MHNTSSFGQQGLDLILEKEKHEDMKNSDWKSTHGIVTSTIRLSLAPIIKYIVFNKATPKEM